MIIRLDPEESSTLTQIAQYTTDPSVTPDMLNSLLEGASADARAIASVLLGEVPEHQVGPDVAETANFFRKWAQNNRLYANARMAAG
jgi:hypothetical protein